MQRGVYTVFTQVTLLNPQPVPIILLAGVPYLSAPSPQVEILSADITLPGSVSSAQIEAAWVPVTAMGSGPGPQLTPHPHSPFDPDAFSQWFGLFTINPGLGPASYGYGAEPGQSGWHFDPSKGFGETIAFAWEGQTSITEATGMALQLLSLYPSPNGITLDIAVRIKEG
jgi:hypothetical protein